MKKGSAHLREDAEHFNFGHGRASWAGADDVIASDNKAGNDFGGGGASLNINLPLLEVGALLVSGAMRLLEVGEDMGYF